MAAEVDFGDLELFEAFDPPEESIPKPVHTRFKDDDGDPEDEDGVGDAELQERLRQCEETIERLRAENILPAGRALSPRARVRAGHGRGGNSTRAGVPNPCRPRGRALRKLPRASAQSSLLGTRLLRSPSLQPRLGSVFRVILDCLAVRLQTGPHVCPSARLHDPILCRQAQVEAVVVYIVLGDTECLALGWRGKSSWS